MHCFFFKQKTAYDMRISDWSSDVALPIFGPKGREALGQLDLLGDLAHRVALVRQPESLVVDEAIEIALLLQQLHDLGVTPGRPVVLGEDHLRLAAPHGQRWLRYFDQGSGSRILAPRSE